MGTATIMLFPLVGLFKCLIKRFAAYEYLSHLTGTFLPAVPQFSQSKRHDDSLMFWNSGHFSRFWRKKRVNKVSD